LTTRTGQPERLLTLEPGPDGRPKSLLVSARYLRTRPAGPVDQLVISLRDAAVRERQERDRAELVSVVSHELRSPLTSVKGFTATLLAKWDRFNDEQKKVMLATVNADADRVTRLIGELLDVSRIDAGRLELRRQVVDVSALIDAVVAGRVAAGEAADRFAVKVGSALPELWADPDKLTQVVGNLVDNALRHGAGQITISAAAQGDGIVVEVADEGEGIPAEVAPRLFTKFWRGGRRAGTGLGLFVARGLVEAHGGSITFGSAAGGGARFTVVLPAGTPDY
jgi:signal transduction histidine kinase